jgi:acyl transferase domain-containing protein
MAAILGLDAETVARACAEAAEGEIVSPANINGAGQVVIAGATAAVQRAGERAKALGAKRVIPLAVSAPFHCALLKPAEDRLEPDLRALPAQRPRIPVVANVDAEPKRDAAAAIDALVRQVSAPVRWEQVVRRLASEGVTNYVEVGPGTVLSGLVKKIDRNATVFNFVAAERSRWRSNKALRSGQVDEFHLLLSTYPRMLELTGKVAIVTGASRGSGGPSPRCSRRAARRDRGGARRECCGHGRGHPCGGREGRGGDSGSDRCRVD